MHEMGFICSVPLFPKLHRLTTNSPPTMRYHLQS